MKINWVKLIYSMAQVKEPILFFISRANFTICDSTEWFGVNHSKWKSFTQSYALDIPRTFSGPQCTHDIRSVCEYLRMAIDYSVQVSLTTGIILSHDDNQTKIVTTANTINTLLTSAGSSRIRPQNVPTYINSSASDNQLCDWFFMFQLYICKGISEQHLVPQSARPATYLAQSLGWFLIAQF